MDPVQAISKGRYGQRHQSDKAGMNGPMHALYREEAHSKSSGVRALARISPTGSPESRRFVEPEARQAGLFPRGLS